MKFNKLFLFLPVALVAAIALAFCTKAQQNTLTSTTSSDTGLIDRAPCTITAHVNWGNVSICGTNTNANKCGSYNGAALTGTVNLTTGGTFTFNVSGGSAFLITNNGGISPDQNASVQITSSAPQTETVLIPLNDTKIVPVNGSCNFGS